jgi:hypothetical protein
MGIALIVTAADVGARTFAGPQEPREPGGIRCEACHGELEFLRQQTPTFARARSLLVRSSDLRGSAHDSLTCVSCHGSFDRVPHPPPEERASSTCASCHEAEHAAWAGSVHASGEEAVCSDCHGVHDVLSVATLAEAAGTARMSAACAQCHDISRLPATDPHVDAVACSSCHGGHGIEPLTGAAHAEVASSPETCGGCHDAVLATWRSDVHGRAFLDGVGTEPEGEESPPGCATCHGVHPTRGVEGRDGQRAMVDVCSSCHEEYAESFADSYHGRASQLGLERAATCAACHTPHGILPAAEAASSVSEANVLATCRSCHAGAGEGFTAFQPHANHHDRERYPQVFWSFWLMTGLLVSTFFAFGMHTLLWLIRLGIEGSRPRHPTPASRKEESP